MLERRDDHMRRRSVPSAARLDDRIDGFGRRLGEDDFVDRRCVQKTAHLFSRGFISRGRRIGQEMQSPVDVGIFVFIGVRDRIDHRVRLLGRSAIVQIDERLAVHLTVQDRKVGANGLDIISQRCGIGTHHP